MYDSYRDVAEFRIVYINEAHAEDSEWAVPYAAEKKISEHDNYKERCSSAELLMNDKSLTIPMIIDEMDNEVNLAYSGWPDRVFVVRTDGKLAVAGKEGPFGFVPALKEAEAWLSELKKTGSEPELVVPERAAPEGGSDKGR